MKDLTVTINDENAETVTVNTSQPELSNGIPAGKYFTDYPVTVTAHANPGYKFKGWEGDVGDTSKSVEISVNGGVTISQYLKMNKLLNLMLVFLLVGIVSACNENTSI